MEGKYKLTEQELRKLKEVRIIDWKNYIVLALMIEGYKQGDNLDLLNKDEFCKYWDVKKSTLNDILKVLCNGYFERSENNKSYPEKDIRDHLHSILGGFKEVATESGRIDLVTDTEIIEVKNIKGWKEAIGQILVYSEYYPNHKKRIHVFGKNLRSLKHIEKVCDRYKISVTSEQTNEKDK